MPPQGNCFNRTLGRVPELGLALHALAPSAKDLAVPGVSLQSLFLLHGKRVKPPVPLLLCNGNDLL